MASYTYEFLELGEEHSLGCKCCRFSSGVDLPIPRRLSNEEISRLATEFSHSIFADWTKLNAILKRFEPTIQKRWQKKLPKQRRDLLLKAWPNMSETHRPDFIGFRKVLKNAPRSRTLPSAALLWPFINLEDLQERHHLLLFLNSRGRNLPEKFVNTDLRSAHLGEGWKTEADDEPYRMEFHWQRTPRTYGRLVRRDCPYDRKRQGLRQKKATGLLVLEIQQSIYSFLLSCAQLLLHDMEPKQFFLAPHQPTPPMPASSTKEWPSLSSHTREVPYRAPEMFNLDRFKALAGARRASAEDHLWLLREDPGYFVDSLKEWKEHDEEMRVHACTRCWRTVADRMIGDAFTLFLYWDWIYRRIDTMRPIEIQLRQADHKALRLARQDEFAWIELYVVVLTLGIFPIIVLGMGFAVSPRLRHLYKHPKHGSNMTVYSRPKLSDAERRVDLLFHAIINDDQRELHGDNHLVQEIQYMLDTDVEAGQLVDSWVTSIFADLAMLSELKLRIEGFEPWSFRWACAELRHTKAVEASTNLLFDLERDIRNALKDAFSSGDIPSAILGDPLDGKYDYPASKRHTEDNVDQMRFAEGCLDALWEELESSVKKRTSLSVNKIIKNRLLEPRELHRTPEWMPPLVAPKAALVLKDRDPNISHFGTAPSVKDVITPAKPKTKIKTRGARGTTEDSDDKTSSPEAPDPRVAEITRTIKVPKRAYKVLSALFPSAGADSHQRMEIAWEELLQAMNTIGLQPEKLYGSVWMFMPKASDECKVEMKRSIQFHEPKEVRRGSKIPPNMVRTFGRRLKQAYGWEDGMFVCE